MEFTFSEFCWSMFFFAFIVSYHFGRDHYWFLSFIAISIKTEHTNHRVNILIYVRSSFSFSFSFSFYYIAHFFVYRSILFFPRSSFFVWYTRPERLNFMKQFSKKPPKATLTRWFPFFDKYAIGFAWLRYFYWVKPF